MIMYTEGTLVDTHCKHSVFFFLPSDVTVTRTFVHMNIFFF